MIRNNLPRYKGNAGDLRQMERDVSDLIENSASFEVSTTAPENTKNLWINKDTKTISFYDAETDSWILTKAVWG